MDNKSPWEKTGNWENELALLKTIIAKKNLVPAIKWGGEVYTLNGKNLIGIGGFKNYFAIWFFNGVFLKDDLKVLVNAQKGITKSLRQWRFSKIDDVNEAEVLQYINEAIANEIQGKILAPSKKSFEMIDLFKKELENNPELALAFNKFTRYKQNEFLEYLEIAKREATQVSRIEKIKPMIIANIGFNDKYR